MSWTRGLPFLSCLPKQEFQLASKQVLKLSKDSTAKNEIKVAFVLSSSLLAIKYGSILEIINWEAVLLSFQSHENLFSFSNLKEQ